MPPRSTAIPGQRAKKILVVDDEPDVTTLVGYHLRAKGYQVETINNPNTVIAQAVSFQPDLVILDVMMPDLNGVQICRMLRADARLRMIAVIFLSAKGEEWDRVQGLEVGADDYICKPFSTKELLLRVQSVIRRLSDLDSDKVGLVLCIGSIEMDIDQHRVAVGGQAVELTATEFKLLRLLMERKGRVQARDHLLLNVWNYETEIETRTVDTHVRRLREKLGLESSLIETVRGVGYRMVDRNSEACST